MSTRKTKDIKNALLDKGFQQDNTHHEMYWYYAKGKKTSVRTRVSHGAAEYDDSLLGLMAKQVRLKRGQLNDLIDCPLKAEGYYELMVDQGHVRD